MSLRFLELVESTLSGPVGIGGGIIIIPALVLLFGLIQHQAHAGVPAELG